ncbi:MAG: PadR family transcriptional regulator [Christensenellaceae bacterium]|jgi:PadR family transcriptional regulator PadR|nr:PadR family transcriptional regulator [Christensenellaceae bacterium]
MDAQIKKGLLDVCVLATLARGESYGWQIIKDVSDVIEISESTLYPILKRLETGGLLITTEVAHNGRLRRYFRITKDGIARIKDFKEEYKSLLKIYEYINGGINE